MLIFMVFIILLSLIIGFTLQQDRILVFFLKQKSDILCRTCEFKCSPTDKICDNDYFCYSSMGVLKVIKELKQKKTKMTKSKNPPKKKMNQNKPNLKDIEDSITYYEYEIEMIKKVDDYEVSRENKQCIRDYISDNLAAIHDLAKRVKI